MFYFFYILNKTIIKISVINLSKLRSIYYIFDYILYALKQTSKTILKSLITLLLVLIIKLLN
ncbi:hypothetical protein AB837_00472 [bacterium AB1]|nr:hypothetical protein AB837_00472 [bacterium AB1]